MSYRVIQKHAVAIRSVSCAARWRFPPRDITRGVDAQKVGGRLPIGHCSSHHWPVATNTLQRQFMVSQTNRVWAGDITYVCMLEGWLYLAVLLDLYSRAVIGWAMGPRLTGDLTEQALHMALTTRRPKAGLLHHSDRGSQYAAGPYLQLLTTHGITASMSRKGNCWDNACVESFFGTLKRELVYHRQYATRSEATRDIFEYVEVFYNRQRRHSTLGYHSPAEYEARVAIVEPGVHQIGGRSYIVR